MSIKILKSSYSKINIILLFLVVISLVISFTIAIKYSSLRASNLSKSIFDLTRTNSGFSELNHIASNLSNINPSNVSLADVHSFNQALIKMNLSDVHLFNVIRDDFNSADVILSDVILSDVILPVVNRIDINLYDINSHELNSIETAPNRPTFDKFKILGGKKPIYSNPDTTEITISPIGSKKSIKLIKSF